MVIGSGESKFGLIFSGDSRRENIMSKYAKIKKKLKDNNRCEMWVVFGQIDLVFESDRRNDKWSAVHIIINILNECYHFKLFY